jgi:hypothetical protein
MNLKQLKSVSHQQLRPPILVESLGRTCVGKVIAQTKPVDHFQPLKSLNHQQLRPLTLMESVMPHFVLARL